jgi:hypothetical protein
VIGGLRRNAIDTMKKKPAFELAFFLAAQSQSGQDISAAAPQHRHAPVWRPLTNPHLLLAIL